MTAIFISDIHLREPESVKTGLVIRFLQEKASRFEEIFILGDLFDVWPATSPYLIEKYEPVLSVLRNLVKGGHRIHYFEGNHDFHLGSYFSEELGIQVYPNHRSFKLSDYNVFITHGDLGNPRDIGYRLLRGFLRQRATRAFIRTLPQSWVDAIGQKSSHLSRDYQARLPHKENGVREIYRNYALKLFQKGYDVVMTGHTHIPDDMRVDVNGRQCRYLNTGDWVKHFSYVEFDGKDFYTRTHPIRGLE